MSAPEDIACSEHLRVRRLTPADRAAMLTVYGDAEAMRWVDDGGVLTPDECDRWLEVTARNYRHYGYGMFAIEELERPGTVIGFIGLVHPGGQEEAEIKYALGRDYWGRGYATEAAKAVLGYGFRHLGLPRIIATTAPENVASHRVLGKAGLHEIAPRHHADGTWDKVFAIDAPV